MNRLEKETLRAERRQERRAWVEMQHQQARELSDYLHDQWPDSRLTGIRVQLGQGITDGLQRAVLSVLINGRPVKLAGWGPTKHEACMQAIANGFQRELPF